MLFGSMLATDDFHAAEFLVWRRNENPIAIVQMQDRGRRNLRICFFFWPRNVAVANMPDAHDSAGIGDLEANFGRADIGIENRANVADSCP